MKLALITSIKPVVPTKGTNAGKQMFVINDEHWTNVEPKPTDTHVCLKDVEKDGKTYVNVAGFSSDTRMSVDQKIKTIISHDAAYSSAIAMLLR